MPESVKTKESIDLSVKMAGINFRSPIGVAAVAHHFGKDLPGNQDEPGLTEAGVLLKHIQAGAGYVYILGFFATEATQKRLVEWARPETTKSLLDAMRTLKAETAAPPYGVEGIYYHVMAPFVVNNEQFKMFDIFTQNLIKILKKNKPLDVPIISQILGLSDLPETYVDGAKRAEELGADLIELNFSCPGPAGQSGAVEDFFQKKFPARFQGTLIGDQPDLVQGIVRQVVKSVAIPVGVKLSAETGFPRIVGVVKAARDAGAKYVLVTGGAVGIVPPDIYNRGKPLWPFMDGNPFCLTSGSWLRRVCYRDVAAIARFVPGIDICAAGGLVTPEHCVEAMMLGASLTQLCTGVMEQGRGFIRKSNEFLRKYMLEQGYQSVQEIIGLGQPYIKYQEEVDMLADRVVSLLDETKCTRCGHCLDAFCTAIYSDKGKIKVNQEKCAGCGGCTIICRQGAFKLVLRS
jgi:dihydropyrimidine dehydrogenase (NAD+) subunit PreA